MIVAVVAVRVVQMALDEVIGMVAMRHGWMPTIRPVLVALRMSTAIMRRCAVTWIRRIDGQGMLFDRGTARVM